MMRDDRQSPDSYELLSTKLVPPQSRGPLVPRDRLLARLDAGVEQKVTLISAPAGFGKTTLASEWIAARRQQNRMPSLAWVSLDSGDNDPVRFWRYVLSACRVFGAEISEPALNLLNYSPQPPFEALLTMLMNKLAQLSGKVVLAREDYHAITSQQIHQTMAFFVDNFPPALHLLLMTRSDPPLPLARLRAYNELNELRAADLRFTAEEIQDFLELAMPHPLPAQVTASLAERTEGWAAGLRLVALAVQRMPGQEETEQYLTSFTGSHRPVLDYLVSDVYRAQPQAIQAFLLQTSILDTLTGPLCDAVTGRDDSAAVLEQLERANLFIVPLRKAGEQWYRYHALFAEAMQHLARRALGQEKLRELAQKASRWYEADGMLAEAIEASLIARDDGRAASLVERIIAPRLVQNEFHTLRRWMEQLPEEALQAHPAICMTFATAILFTSPRHSPETKQRLQRPLEIAEAHWQRIGDDHKLGEVYAFRSLVDWLQGDLEESFAWARQGLAFLPEGDRQWGGISLIMLAVDEMLRGDLNVARQTITEALARCEAAQNIYGTLDSMLLLGELYYQQGELQQAEQLFHQVLARVESDPMSRDQARIRRGRARLGAGMLALEWNDLETAAAAAEEAVAIREQFPQEDLLADSPIVLARVQFARGESVEAQRLLGALLAHGRRSSLFRFPELTRARLALADGDLAAAERWLVDDALSRESAWPVRRQQHALLLARLQMAQGEAAAAIARLADLLDGARAGGQTRRKIEIGILLALAHAAVGSKSRAQEFLIQALATGRPAGHRRIFLDEGERLAQLVQETLPEIADDSLAAYARGLLYGYAQEQAAKDGPRDAASLLIEPLTEQEQRVLRLLSAGLSNPQIAEELVISVNTVKTHLKNIYGKLAVSSRDEAAEAARHLNLL